MGTFIGHVYPGLFLFLHGLYQAVVISKALTFSDSLLYPSSPPRNKGRCARLWKISYGGLLKMVTGCLLTVYEVSCIKGGLILMNRELPPRFMYPKEWQHLTMFILLTLNGCVDFVSKNVLPQRRVGLEKGALVLIIYELLLLMVSHVKESEGVELHVHSLLILVVFLLLLVFTAELWAPNMCHLQLMETFLILLMGSWLMQAGFILYRPVSGYPWQDDDISDIMFVTTFFCWHVMIDASCLLGIYGFSSFWHHCYTPSLKLTGPKEAPYYASPPGPLYELLQEVEQSEKEDQVLLFSKSSPETESTVAGTSSTSPSSCGLLSHEHGTLLGENNGLEG
ncbi:transmembrane epididymal protein 1-like isoform X1 [Saimiri boliviensis]|uniref:transmembrane epididymal protein 1-like isoform X1 n=2 Tax=Saimiri boliviensis TaxID=27679 RepID=UPI000533DC83|nr:transmembrane epididymal protein 1-like [Saimiri boliviensis boliviensis]